jgi:hypothetical protein
MGPYRRRARERAARVTTSPATPALKPGRSYEARHMHESYCRRPQGEACTCPNGPDVELLPMLDPAEN